MVLKLVNYAKNKIHGDPDDFDIGHHVRREDPVWGDTAEFAIKCNDDTFHSTNACPQHKNFNQGNNDKPDPR